MDLRCLHLSLAPHWADEDDERRIFLVRSIDAIALGGGGYDKVSPTSALWIFERESHRLMWEMRDFAARAGLVERYSTRFEDQDVIEAMVAALRRGSVVGLRKGTASSAAAMDPTMEDRRLVQGIESRTRGRLSEGGRQYRLVVGADVAGIPDRNNYEVVRQDEARRVLGALVTESAGQASVGELLAKATNKLSPDWRPPMTPKGLVLLRRIHARNVAAGRPESAITPSQMRAMIEDGWIEIEFVDEFGEPVEAAYRLQLTDSTMVEGLRATEGEFAVTNIKPGTCKLTLPELDAAMWRIG